MRIIYLFFILLVFTGCNKEQNSITTSTSPQNIISIDIPNDVGKVEGDSIRSLTDLFSGLDLYVIKDDQNPLGRIRQVIVTEKYLYIFDVTNKSISTVNFKGEISNIYSKRGSGPDEYIEINTLSVYKDTLVIYDQNKKQLHFINNGKLFKKEDFNSYYYGHAYIGNDVNVFYTNNQPNEFDIESKLLFVNNSNKLIKNYVNFDNANEIRGFKVFSDFNDEIFFQTGLNDTIYSISSAGFEPRIIMKFQNNPSTVKDDIIEMTNSKFGFVNNMNKIKDFLFFELYTPDHKFFTCLFDTRHNKFINLINLNGHFTKFLRNNKFAVNQKYYFSIIRGSAIIEYLESINKNLDSIKLDGNFRMFHKNLLNDKLENYVLLKYTFK